MSRKNGLDRGLVKRKDGLYVRIYDDQGRERSRKVTNKTQGRKLYHKLKGAQVSDEDIEGILGRPRRAIKHGVDAFRKNGRLPLGKEWITEAIEAFRAGLIADLGGDGEVSTAETILIDSLLKGKTCEFLLSEYLAEAVSAKKRDGLYRVLGMLNTYLCSTRQALAVLGLKRRTKEKTIFDAMRDAEGETS